MKFLNRVLDLKPILQRKSLFLLGPRQTGKSLFLQKMYPHALYIDLLLSENFSTFLKEPGIIRKKIELYFLENRNRIVIIDEIQKIPQLLNEIHYLIEKFKDARFILTGSSARKLKAGNVNMLGGRASLKIMYPFCYKELSTLKEPVLDELLLTGCIASIAASSEPFLDLQDYVNLYLKEEIKLEGLVRNLGSFSNFLELVAISCTEQITYSSFARDAQISSPTAKEYFQILEDTLLGIRLAPFRKTTKRKAITSSKFYFFDVGLINAILKRRTISNLTPEFGTLVEQYIFQELRAYLGYTKAHFKMEYWRTTDKTEVDFIIYDTLKNITAIEVKTTHQLKKKDFRGLLRLDEEFPVRKKIIVTYKGHSYLEDNGVEVYNIHDFLKKLWGDKIISN